MILIHMIRSPPRLALFALRELRKVSIVPILPAKIASHYGLDLFCIVSLPPCFDLFQGFINALPESNISVSVSAWEFL
jgi:hypothetical protein